MLSEGLLTKEQNAAIDRLYENDSTLLVASMGAGKSVVTLTALKSLLDDGVCKRILVVAPVKVCNLVWGHECQKWGHLQGLEVANAAGSNAKKRAAALDSGAPVVCINFENLAWLFREYKPAFDGLVVDELTKLKNTGGAQFKALRPQLKNFAWRVGMTGTVVSEDWEGLFGQMLVVDGGARLGTRKDAYLRQYFYPTDYNEYNWAMYDFAPAEIAKKIQDVVYTMPDYRHELPALNVEYTPLPMPHASTYDRLKADMVVDLPNGTTLTADTAAVLIGKLSQAANGFLYGPMDDASKRGETQWYSEFKIEYIRARVREFVSLGRPVVLVYWFDADRQRLLAEYPDAEMSDENVERWNKGELPVLLLHPRSAGHGLNLAAGGGDMLWLGPVWSRDLTEQTIARVWRRGQTRPVNVEFLMAENSVDYLMRARVDGKADFERMFKHHFSLA